MRPLLVLLVLGTSALVDGQSYSYSPSVGLGTGSSFALTSKDNITAVRLYEVRGAYISGIQLRFGSIWTSVIGRNVGYVQELELFQNEHIHQVSGKYHPSNHIYSLVISTSTGRSIMAGRPVQISFNMYPEGDDQQLIMLSGRFNHNGITAIAAHWGPPGMEYGNNTSSS